MVSTWGFGSSLTQGLAAGSAGHSHIGEWGHLWVPMQCLGNVWHSSLLASSVQGDTPKHRAEKANDPDLAAYLENRQHYQMIQREDQETAV